MFADVTKILTRVIIEIDKDDLYNVDFLYFSTLTSPSEQQQRGAMWGKQQPNASSGQ